MTCQLCGAPSTTNVPVSPRDDTIALCDTCATAVAGPINDGPHWQCLNDAIWSTDAATQVTAFRLLHKLEAAWATELLDIAYLEPEVQSWAEAGLEDDAFQHRDSNGALLAQGDSVVLIKDLPVKGAGFTAKRGTAVRNISLVPDNAGHIEGRVEGQRIVILTQFVKKT
jgi:protein PhnA